MKTKLVRIAMTAIALCALALLFAPQAANAAPTAAKTSTGGTWGTANTWSPSGVPTAADDVTILSGTVTASTSGQVAHNVTINSGATLTLSSQNLNVAGDWTNNGTFTNGGVGVVFTATTGTQTISGTGTGQFAQLAINDGSTTTSGANVQLLVDVTAGETTNSLQLQTGDLDLNGHTLTLNGTSTTSRGIRVMGTPGGGTRTIFSSTGTGTLLISGTKYVCGVSGTNCGSTSWSNAGTLTIGSGATIALGATFDFNGSTTGATTVNGTVQINSGGSLLNSHAPTYSGTASTLAYNTTVNPPGVEWGAGASVGSGVPQNVTILSSGAVTLTAARTVPGTLTLTGGTLTNGTYLTLSNGGTIVRDVGTLSAAPTFGTTVNVTYTGTTAVTSGNELPTSTTVLNNLTINKSGGVTLGASKTANGALALTSGNLTTGANTLTMGQNATTSGNYDVVGTTQRTSFGGTGDNTYGSAYTKISGFATNPTSMSVVLAKQLPSNSGLQKVVVRDYTLTMTGGSVSSGNVQLHYRDTSDTTGAGCSTPGCPDNLSALKLWRWNNTQWVLQGGSNGGSGDASYVAATGVGAFSPWGIAQSSPTAVTLSSFSGKSVGLDPLGLIGVGVLGMAVLGVIGFVTIRRRSR